MHALRFTFGAILIVASALLLLGAGAVTLGVALGELPDTAGSFGRLAAYLLIAALCAYGGYRVLRAPAAPQTPPRR